MTTPSDSSVAAATATAGVAAPPHRKLAATKYLGVYLLVLLAVAAVAIGARLYQEEFAFKYALDSTTVEFETYWMSVFYGEIAFIVVFGASLWAYLFMTRDKHLDQITPSEEITRLFNLAMWLGTYVFVVYWAASFFAEEDAAWHQTIVRDTSFTASHILLFYGLFPLYIVVGVASLIYAYTRVPTFANRFSIVFLLAILGPFLLLPNVGYNEWGHTFWLMEEWFSAPLHWGFVVFAWTGLALGGVLSQIAIRLVKLLGFVKEEQVMETTHM
jgi:methane/ammonia monooxygenase subunit C